MASARLLRSGHGVMVGADDFEQLEALPNLASFEKIIPLKCPSDLQGSTTLTAKLLTRSEGTIGELKMLLAAVATDAMRKGTERITEELIATCNYVPPSARKQRSVSG